MTILVIAEHDNQSLNLNTFNTITAATQLGDEIHLLIAGNDAEPVAKEAQAIPALQKVLLTNHLSLTAPLAENMATLIKSIANDYSHILSPASNFGKNFSPRLAAMIDVMQVSDIIEVISPDTFIRPIYAGNALVEVQCLEPIKVITIRSTAFEDCQKEGGNASVENLNFEEGTHLVSFLGRDVTTTDRPDLTTANVVVSGGRGVGSKEHFGLIESLAEKLNAAVGASRAAVDAGFAPNDFQVGQTGKIVAPEIYFAVGISGAIQHQAGMRESKIIVAINKDEDAPIFQIADFGIVDDLFKIVPELIEAL